MISENGAWAWNYGENPASNVQRTLALLGRRWVQGFGERSPRAVRRRIAEAERAQGGGA